MENEKKRALKTKLYRYSAENEDSNTHGDFQQLIVSGTNSSVLYWTTVLVRSYFFQKAKNMYVLRASLIFHNLFSNLLIISQLKTKKITTVKEAWIPGLN